VAARQGLLAKSFELAAEAYSDATGGNMSKDSLRRVTEGWGQGVEAKRQTEAQQVYAVEAPQAVNEVVTVHKPIQGLANISTDGGMILLREEGWKEVKMSVISEVVSKRIVPTKAEASGAGGILLKRHSYQAGLWDADEMGQHQYLEGARRQVQDCKRLSSTNDGAPWIDRITTSNFPRAVQIIDWHHAQERLWKVAKAAFGEGTLSSRQWAEQQIDR